MVDSMLQATVHWYLRQSPEIKTIWTKIADISAKGKLRRWNEQIANFYVHMKTSNYCLQLFYENKLVLIVIGLSNWKLTIAMWEISLDLSNFTQQVYCLSWTFLLRNLEKDFVFELWLWISGCQRLTIPKWV